MSTGYLLLLAAIAAVCIYFGRQKKEPEGDFEETTKTDNECVDNPEK